MNPGHCVGVTLGDPPCTSREGITLGFDLTSGEMLFQEFNHGAEEFLRQGKHLSIHCFLFVLKP